MSPVIPVSLTPHSRTRVPGPYNRALKKTSNPQISANNSPAVAYNSEPVTSVTISKTIDQGNSTILLVICGVRNFVTFTSVTFNGMPCTKIISNSYASGNNGRIEIWYMLRPPVGTFDIVCTVNSGDWLSCGAASYDNVSQITPFTNCYMTQGTGVTTASCSAVGVTYGLMVAGIAHEGIGTRTSGSGIFTQASDGNWWTGASYITNEDFQTLSWTISTNSYAMAAIVLNRA